MTDRILSRQVHAAAGADAWRVVPDGAYAFFASDSFPLSVRFVEESAVSCMTERQGGTR